MSTFLQFTIFGLVLAAIYAVAASGLVVTYTTKGIFNHRGLGLSSAYGIIANHNGFIDVESILGSGTTIAIYLPAIPES